MYGLWSILGFDILKDNNKKLEKINTKLEDDNTINLDIINTIKKKLNELENKNKKLENENKELQNENKELVNELKINNEIIDNLYTDNDKNLLEHYKLKLIDLNKYKERTNSKIIKLEIYNKQLIKKYNKVNELNNYKKAPNQNNKNMK